MKNIEQKCQRKIKFISKSDFHTIIIGLVRVLVFSVLNVSVLMRVRACKKLERTMHVHVRHLSQNSFDLF